MLLPLLVSLSLVQRARSDSTNTTATVCSSSDAEAFTYRSVWSLLASSGLTLLICVWHAIHPALPLPHFKRFNIALYRFILMLLAFFAPELMIWVAFDEWREAKRITKRARGRGHHWWTMTHSHFVLIGGFVLCDNIGFKEIGVNRFLSLAEAGDIVNPVITKDEIIDKSTSDPLGKAVLAAQLSWFMIQIVSRLSNHLSVALVELDVAGLAVLTLPLIFFWWNKPRGPRFPHIFYTRNADNSAIEVMLRRGDSFEKLLGNTTIKTNRSLRKLIDPTEGDNNTLIAFLLAWAIFGGLHAAAWNHDFPSETERTLWRMSSLILAGTPIMVVFAMVVAHVLDDKFVSSPVASESGWVAAFFLFIIGIVSRVLLVILMLTALRGLPTSAHCVINWTHLLPHLP